MAVNSFLHLPSRDMPRNPAQESAQRFMALVARNLWLARRARGLSQADAARLCGLTGDQVAKWERGEKQPSAGLLKVLTHFAYHWQLDYFFDEHPPFERDGLRAPRVRPDDMPPWLRTDASLRTRATFKLIEDVDSL